MNGRAIFGTLLLWLAAAPALAGTPVQLPEPGVIELLAISGIVGLAIAIRKRRK